MTPDLAMLRDLVESTPEIRRWPGSGAPENWARAAEARVGRLPASYRWWLTETRASRVGHVDVASLADPEHVAAADDALTAGWRLAAGRLCFASEPDGAETFSFALDRTGGNGEHLVVRVDGTDGSEEVVAETFAGFVSVQVALLRGLGDGPNPTIAELWRSTPGALHPGGLTVHGPHRFSEANAAHDVPRLAPHWVLVGEDGEGAGLFMRRHGRDRTSVHRLDLAAFAGSHPGEGGSRIEADGELVTTDLLGWLEGGPAA
ncbi:SMI1/KNR4 family protein [Oerskovia jenensis]|uniref:SMI1/KNR4 family protein n=1 Tax=Oerskovia jenensis TaxID=162169 RepID=UPI0036DAD791